MTEVDKPWWGQLWLQVLVVATLALGLNAPYLFAGFAADDVLFLDLLRQEPRPFTWWGGLWSVRDPSVWNWSDFASFRALWWQEPNTLGTFWRPIFSFVFAGSVALFGENALPLHAVSLVAHALIGVGLVLFVRKFLRDQPERELLALLSGLLFVACEDHSLGVGWIATMTDMLCLLGVMYALLAYLHWLQTRRVWAIVLSMLCLAFAFGAKESAATAPVVMVWLAFLAPKGVDEAISLRRAAWRERWHTLVVDVASWLCPVLMLCLYLVLYRGLGFGGMDNLMYLDPLSRPFAYLGHAAVHLPVLFLGALSPVPPSIIMFFPQTLLWTAMAGFFLFWLWLVGLWRFRQSGLALWALGMFLITLLPQVSTDASERGLYVPFIGAAILFALMLARLRGPYPRWERVVAWTVLLCVFVPGALLSAVMPVPYAESFAALDREAKTAIEPIERYKPDTIIILNTSGMMQTFYVSGILEHALQRKLDLTVLSSAEGDFVVERVAEHAFILRTDRPGWLGNMFARAVRRVPRLEVGRGYRYGPLRATLLDLTADGDDVLAIRFELALNDPKTLFLFWDGKRFLPYDWSRLDIGETEEL